MATIQGVYVALFGRPADPTGLAYFNSVTSNGANLNGIGDLAGTQEFKDRFKDFSNTQIVNSIYNSLFGRDAEAAGLNFFVDALNKGTLNVKNIAIAILDGAQGTDKTIVTNKVAAADLYTKALDTPVEIASYVGNNAAAAGRTFISGVTTTVPTAGAVDTAVATMVTNSGVPGNTLSLVTGTDAIVVGTAATNSTDKNDTFNAKDGAGLANFWAPASDTINGGFGTDTLNATMYVTTAAATSGKVATDGLKSVEVVNVTSTGVATNLDLTAAKELTQIWNVGSTGNFSAIGLSAAQTTAGLSGALGTNTSTFGFTGVGTSDTAKLAFNAATGTGAVSIASAGTIAITNSGTSSQTNLTFDAAKTVTVAGSGDLTIGFATTTVTEAVNSSSFSGNLNANVGGLGNLKTVTTGGGNDTVTIDVTHANDVTINTGAGNDTINVVSDAGATKAIALTGGAGADAFVFGATGTLLANVNLAGGATAAEIVKTLVTVSDFDKAADAIKVVAGTPATARATLTGTDLGTISGQSDLYLAASKAAELANFNSGASKVAVFAYGTDSYIYQDVDGSGALSTGDMLVKVAGVSDVTSFTATNFVLAA
ncbi:DUF4214 domain-containing protein [Rhizobium sp. SSA_523]|uniref:beta strand repeat-containing protein n=1 Tax=Rhizobium sp. SSA_523 TaxID=2952477 RepID=UPI0020908619|nr:DUF4214 domain-containing protein [Rhizobium sp. SSA_523]MCO5734147.1 DUF4214 domain-containing protein [Rhizobium sp. SSA_523]WKC24783.1 DUF4214 domain-containing protein [Rhizobium sp. SSA_523]